MSSAPSTPAALLSSMGSVEGARGGSSSRSRRLRLADVIAGHRRLLEEIVWRVRALETRASERVPERHGLDAGAHAREEAIELGERPRG